MKFMMFQKICNATLWGWVVFVVLLCLILATAKALGQSPITYTLTGDPVSKKATVLFYNASAKDLWFIGEMYQGQDAEGTVVTKFQTKKPGAGITMGYDLGAFGSEAGTYSIKVWYSSSAAPKASYLKSKVGGVGGILIIPFKPAELFSGKVITNTLPKKDKPATPTTPPAQSTPEKEKQQKVEEAWGTTVPTTPEPPKTVQPERVPDCDLSNFRIDSLVRGPHPETMLASIYFSGADSVEAVWEILEVGKKIVSEGVIWNPLENSPKHNQIFTNDPGNYIVSFKMRKKGCLESITRLAPFFVPDEKKHEPTTAPTEPKKNESPDGAETPTTTYDQPSDVQRPESVANMPTLLQIGKWYNTPAVLVADGRPPVSLRLVGLTPEGKADGLEVGMPAGLKSWEVTSKTSGLTEIVTEPWGAVVTTYPILGDSDTIRYSFESTSPTKFYKFSWDEQGYNWNNRMFRAITKTGATTLYAPGPGCRYGVTPMEEVDRLWGITPQVKLTKIPAPPPTLPLDTTATIAKPDTDTIKVTEYTNLDTMATSVQDWTATATLLTDTNLMKCDFCKTEHEFALTADNMIVSNFKPKKGEKWGFAWVAYKNSQPYLVHAGDKISADKYAKVTTRVYLVFKKLDSGWSCKKKVWVEIPDPEFKIDAGKKKKKWNERR